MVARWGFSPPFFIIFFYVLLTKMCAFPRRGLEEKKPCYTINRPPGECAYVYCDSFRSCVCGKNTRAYPIHFDIFVCCGGKRGGGVMFCGRLVLGVGFNFGSTFAVR